MYLDDLLDAVNLHADYLQHATASNVTSHFDEFSKDGKLVFLRIRNCDLHHLLRADLIGDQRKDAIVATDEILSVKQNGNGLVLHADLRVDSYDVNRSLGKVLVGILEHISGLRHAERGDVMRDIHHFGLCQLIVNRTFYGTHEVIFGTKIGC